MFPLPLPEWAHDPVRLVTEAGHTPAATPRHDGPLWLPVRDSHDVVLDYRRAHRPGEARDVHAQLQQAGADACATVLREAGYRVTPLRHAVAQAEPAALYSVAPPSTGAVSAEALPDATEPVPQAPPVCACAPNRAGDNACPRAERRVIAAAAVTRATFVAEKQLLAALCEAATEMVSHPVRGPETAAALMDHARALVTDVPAPPPPAELLADPACEGCTSAACAASNGRAAAAIAGAVRVAALHLTTVGAARTVVDQAHVFMAEGTERRTAIEVSERLQEVLRTAATALGRTRSEQQGRGRPYGVARVSYYNGKRQWFTRGGRARW